MGEAHYGIVAVRIEHAHVVAERIAEALTARAPPQLLESPVATALHECGSAPPAPLITRQLTATQSQSTATADR